MALQLSNRYRFCVANNRVVLLDLDNGTYSCLPDGVDQAFRHLADGGKGTDEVIRALQPLIDDNILWIDFGGHGLPGIEKVPRPTSSLFDEIQHELPLAPNIPRLASRFLREWTVDRLPLTQTLRLLARRRPAPKRQIDDPVVRKTLRAHLATRRWLATRDRCLPWSAALVDILRDHGGDARLVIGVRTAPWSAHAWAEHEGMVLNDSLDNVSPYTPILAA